VPNRREVGEHLAASVAAIWFCKSLSAQETAARIITKTACEIIGGHPQSKVDDLMPWRFRKTSSQYQ
jgi:hypothetical protein